MIKLAIFLVVIGTIGSLLVLLYQLFLKWDSQKKSNKTPKQSFQKLTFTNNQDVTDYIKRNYNQIEAIKRKGRHRTDIDNQWLKKNCYSYFKVQHYYQANVF